MEIIKNCTSLEQSYKLAEILPLESADMHYATWTILDNEFIVSPNQGSTIESLQEDYGNQIIPCWSLAALLSVLPDTITSNDGIAFKLNIKKNIIEYSNPSLYLIYKSVKSDNLIDIAYEMILKLHKLNFL